MKAVLLTLVILSITKILSAQYTYTIKADSVKITGCDSAELILENHTQGVPGFLFNTGNGRTVFKRPLQKINDTLYLVGGDTLKIHPGPANAWVQGGNSFGATGVLGTIDSNHLDLYTYDTARARLTKKGNLLLGTTADNNYKLQVNGGWSTTNTSYLNTGSNTNVLDFNYSTAMRWTGLPDANLVRKTLFYQYRTGIVKGSWYIAPWSAVGDTLFAPTGPGNYVFGGGGGLTTGSSNTLIGYGAGKELTTGAQNVFIGSNAGIGLTTSHNVLSIRADGDGPSEFGSTAGLTKSMFIGEFEYGDDPITTNNTAVIGMGNGSGNSLINNYYFGAGGVGALYFGSNVAVTFQPSKRSSGVSDGSALDFRIAGGIGTGTGGTGCIIFSTASPTSSGTTQQSLTERARFATNTGNFLLGTTADSGNLLQVHGSSYFTGSVRMSGLTSDTAKTRVLVSDASGNLSYRTLSSWVMNDIPGSSLALNGPVSVEGALSANSVRVKQTGWPDYVFAHNYALPPLGQIENYIRQHNHLPGIPSAADVGNKGLNLGENQAALLKKIEELTLYMIDQDKAMKRQEEEIALLKEQNKELRALKEEMEEMKKLIKP